jgi:hypothetical protein
MAFAWQISRAAGVEWLRGGSNKLRRMMGEMGDDGPVLPGYGDSSRRGLDSFSRLLEIAPS